MNPRTLRRGRQRAFLGLVAVLACLCAGCKVGPDYCPPSAAIPDFWSQELKEGVQVTPQLEATDTAWWSVFADPALDQLIAEAAGSNLELRRTGARILEARAQWGVVRGGLFPNADLKGSYTRNQISNSGNPFGIGSGGAFGGFTGFKPYDLLSTGFEANWELDLFGRVRRSLEAAGAQIDVAVEDQRAVAVSLFAEVASTYVDMRTQQERIAIAIENARIQQDTMQLTKNRFDAGVVSELDVAQATSNLRNTEAAIPALRAQLRQTMNRLCVLRAQLPRDLKPELGETGKIPVPPAEVVIGLPVVLLRQRPDVRRAEREMAAQSARVGVAVADLYPDVSLLGTFTVDSVDLKHLFDANSIAYRLTGPSVRWNFLNFGRVRNNIRVQDARLEQAMIGFERTVLTSIEEVENALTSYLEQQQRLRQLEQADTAGKRAEGLARSQYLGGRTNFQSLLDAQKFRLLVEEQRTGARGNVAQALVSLYRALGGGWEYGAFMAGVMTPGSLVEPVPPGNQVERSAAP